jgi:hypothetical protein
MATESFAHDFLTYDPAELDAGPAASCITRLEESDVAAVSVRAENLDNAGRLIARSCLRSGAPPLHLLAFENVPQAGARLLKSIETEVLRLTDGVSRREIIAHAAIPDRACMSRKLEDDVVCVEAERFGEIVLEDSARFLFPEILNPQPPVPYVRHVESDSIPLAERRKFWLVNGTHVALGVLCYDFNWTRLNDGLSNEDVSAILHSLHEEWVQILHTAAREDGRDVEVFTATELAAHAERMFNRIRDLPDFSVRDVLKELIVSNPTHMPRLMQKLDDRLAEPVRKANDFGAISVPASGWMLAKGVGTIRTHADTYIFGGGHA